MPDKALDILDEACARKSTMNQKLGNDKEYKKYEETLVKIQKKIEDAIENKIILERRNSKQKRKKPK